MNISKPGDPRAERSPAWEGDDAPPTGLHLRELAWNAAPGAAASAKRGPRGPDDGPPVLVIPGFLCTTRPRWRCARAGRGGLSGPRLEAGLEPRRPAPTRSSGSPAGRQASATTSRSSSSAGASAASSPVSSPATIPSRSTRSSPLARPFTGDPQPEQCLAALRMGRAAQGRRPADPAHHRQAAGPAPCHLVAPRRPHRPARRPRPDRRERQGGRVRLPPHGVRGFDQGRSATWCRKSTTS